MIKILDRSLKKRKNSIIVNTKKVKIGDKNVISYHNFMIYIIYHVLFTHMYINIGMNIIYPWISWISTNSVDFERL